MTYNELILDKEINEYIKYSDECLCNMGFTEHGFAHVKKVVNIVEYILTNLHCDTHIIELGKIAAYMHDIGNCVNREYHSHSGAIMAQRLLKEREFSIQDIAKISYAIGNHDENSGYPADYLSAALILADKADIRQSRVRKKYEHEFDIHDRVNYSVTHSELICNVDNIILQVTLNNAYSNTLDFYEIFLNRMLLCKKAAQVINKEFILDIQEVSACD